jgi:adenylate cyclase
VISALARHPRFSLLIAGLVAVLAATAVIGARSLGLLQAFELVAYDAGIRWRPFDPPPDARIALVTVTERDILAKGWPLSDEILARAIETVARHGPRAIGLDVYRDVPVAPGSRQLDELFAADPRVIAVMKFAEGGSSGVAPPRALRETQQVGFNDILVDPGGTVRRGVLFLDDGATVSYSLPLRLALLSLASRGIAPQPDAQDSSLLRLGRATIRPLDPGTGGYAGADARGYQFLLDFKGAKRSFDAVKLSDLFAGSFDPGLFRDRIVLIGVTAESIKDDFYTPLSAGLRARQAMPGVVVHAHIASQLLRMALDDDAPMDALPEWQEWLWILLFSFGGALLGLGVREPWRFSLAALGGLFGLAAIAYLAFLAGRWIPVVPPMLGWLSAAGVVTAYMSYRETAQRTLLMQLFSRLVSQEVAEEIWRRRNQFLDGGRLRPERMVVTALFTDLTGFTTVSEKHSPEALLDWLNEYMDAMAREVSRHGGVVRQYAGDAIVAIFGIPVPRQTDVEIDRDARRAVNCALAMENALRELNRRWQSENRPTTGMRVGIFTGPVVSGTLGSAERSEYVVVGDTVNTASRLEAFEKELFHPVGDARPGRILIGEPTLLRLDGEFETERVGEVSLKGKEHRIGVHRVIRRRQRAAGSAEESVGAEQGAGAQGRATAEERAG